MALDTVAQAFADVAEATKTMCKALTNFGNSLKESNRANQEDYHYDNRGFGHRQLGVRGRPAAPGAYHLPYAEGGYRPSSR